MDIYVNTGLYYSIHAIIRKNFYIYEWTGGGEYYRWFCWVHQTITFNLEVGFKIEINKLVKFRYLVLDHKP